MNSLYLQPTTKQEIIEICASFRAGTAAGYDQITMNVLKKNEFIFKFWYRSRSNEDSPTCSFI